jgi:hypothetical protein
MSFRKYGGLQFSSKNNYNNLINVTSTNDLPQTIGVKNTTIDVFSSLDLTDNITVNGVSKFYGPADCYSTLSIYDGVTNHTTLDQSMNALIITNPEAILSVGVPTFIPETGLDRISALTVEALTDTRCIYGRAPISITPSEIYIQLAGGGGYFNGVSQINDVLVVAGSALGSDVASLTLTTKAHTTCGIRISPTTIAITSLNTNNTGTISITSDVGTTIHGPAIFASTTAPTSAQFPALASNDSSTSIPTTAWVQTAITNSSGGGSGTITYTYTTGVVNQSVSVPTGSNFVEIICIGAGGGGGGGLNSSTNPSNYTYESGGGGGGGGGISITSVALSGETSLNITVGSGGIGGDMQITGTSVSAGANGGNSYVSSTLNSTLFYYAYAYGGSGGQAAVSSNNVQPSGGAGGYGTNGVGGNGGNGCGTTNSITGSAYLNQAANGFLVTGINGNTSNQLGAGGGGGGGACVPAAGYTSYGGNGGGIGYIGYSSTQGNAVGGINAPFGTNTVTNATSPTTGPKGVGGGGGGGSPGTVLVSGASFTPTATNGKYGGVGGGGGSASYSISKKAGSGGNGLVILTFSH